jgi:membrane protein DedA with SNARE-associated domain
MPNLTDLIESFPYTGIILLLFLGELGLPFPEDTTLLLSGFLISQEIVRPVPMLLTVYAALLTTDLTLYAVGRKYGRKIVEHRRFQKFISSDRLSRIEEKFRKRGVLVVLVGRHVIGLRSQIFIAAGVMQMSWLRFILADAASAVVTIALMVGIGYFGGQQIEVYKEGVSKIEHIVAAVFVLTAVGVLLTYLLRRKRGNNRS